MDSRETELVDCVRDAFARVNAAFRQSVEAAVTAWKSVDWNCNRRARKAWSQGQASKALYYMGDHAARESNQVAEGIGRG